MAALITALEAAQAGMQAMEQINRMNENGQAQVGEGPSDAVDPQQDPNLVPDNGNRMSITAGMRLQIGSLDIGIMVNFTKEKGKENTPEVGVEAQNEQGQTMQGLLAQEPENDLQNTFSDEAWDKVQRNRALCLDTAKRQLEALTNTPANEPELNK